MGNFQFLSQAHNVYDLILYCVELLESEQLDRVSKKKLGVHLRSFENEITLSWAVEDVIQQANEDHKKVTEEQAREVLNIMRQHHDANYGICWQTISDTISNNSNFK